jgi:hypothetical protein
MVKFLQLIENGFFYNIIHTKPIEVFKGNHFSDFKTILVSFGARKIIVVDLDVVIPMNLLSKPPFHNVIIIKFVPLNPHMWWYKFCNIFI